jgi:SAM-dependent methyltransferase
MAHEQHSPLRKDVHRMKRDWDARAVENAKWYINTIKREQQDDEFDDTGRQQVEALILGDLQLLTAGQNPRSLRLLEIGCGIGRMTRYLASIFGEVHAVDVSGEMVRQAQTRLADLHNVSIYETDGLGFEALSDNYFDLAFSAYVFQHVPSAAVIRANIVDTMRVLRPGGIFKFQTNGVTRNALDDLEKDTWTGASFQESEIRRLARELDARLLGVSGGGTQYCWSMLRKRSRTVQTSTSPRTSPQPEIVFYGRADNPKIKLIPASGDYACVTLIVSGLDPDEVDANNILVEIGRQTITACYVGPLGNNYDSELRKEFGEIPASLVQINAILPQTASRGLASVCTRVGDGPVSRTVEIELGDSAPNSRIHLVTNTYDGGTDVQVSGVKSAIRLLVEGLDEETGPDDVALFIGAMRFRPDSVEFIQSKGLYTINAQLPSGVLPGETHIGLRFRAQEMVTADLEILPNREAK